LQQWNVAFQTSLEELFDGRLRKNIICKYRFATCYFGVELFPKKSFNLRLGYNFRRAEELRILEQRNFSGVSFGLG
jgi:hypothetical protein